MSKYSSFIDNNRVLLKDEILKIAPNHKVLRIATGYWDLPGFDEIINELENYQKIKLIIGREPLASRYQEKLQLDLERPENLFPDEDIKYDLNNIDLQELNDLRKTAKKLVEMIEKGVLEVKVFRKPILHAKAYIFGELDSDMAVGIIGSSNFTRAGLTKNKELNFLTDEHRIVTFEPKNNTQEHGHITWFEELWNSDGAEDWDGSFTEIIGDSQVGELTFGPYDVYIKTLMEVFPEELVKIEDFEEGILEYLHPFQNQNASSLRRKLYTNGMAMLSDSVGLGKTVTAASIINQYINDGKNNIVLLLPASLKYQWIEELEGHPWYLTYNRDFRIVTQQNHKNIKNLTEHSLNEDKRKNKIDLFVIDEAHNYRNPNSTGYEATLELLQANPDAHVLLLTATPINNSLMDFGYVIQLGSKGDLETRKVRYKPSEGENVQRIDFIEALRKIQSQATKAEKRNEKFDWNQHKGTLVNGLRHYLVRSTRQGVIKREAMKNIDSDNRPFPKSKVRRFDYIYSDNDRRYVKEKIIEAQDIIFEKINTHNLNIELLTDITQRSMHPIDIIKKIDSNNDNGKNIKYFNLGERSLEKNIIDESFYTESIIQSIFKIINTIGFVPYKLDTYTKGYYGKSINELREKLGRTDIDRRIRMQMSIHNMLQVTWLKRLESSTGTLLKSVENYLSRLLEFEKWLEKGYLISLVDIDRLTYEYDDDTERAFEDYNQYLKELERQQGNESNINKKGIIKRNANQEIYEIDKLKKDLERDKKIISLLINILNYLSSKDKDAKLNTFAEKLTEIIKRNSFGKKAIIFSFFSDTIHYLEQNLPELMKDKIKDFDKKSAFITGASNNSSEIAKRFSPKSQNYKINKDEIDFLFATDVLSEGQNLQDAGILINFDLHWNPVRMIQRNGRINRLGSEHDKILIANATPHDDLEVYLKLVRRLENKIEAINNSIGNDQSVLGEDANPIEFIEQLDGLPTIYSINEEVASNALDNFETNDSLIDWIDDYSLELREFIDTNPEHEIERIKNMPKGKWNYLPEHTDTYSNKNEILGLFVAKGTDSNSGNEITDSIFVKIRKQGDFGPFSSINASYIPEEEALAIIKTTPDDNKRIIDNIKLDREEYIKNTKVEVINRISTSKNKKFSLSNSQVKTLDYISKFLPEYNHLMIIQNKITKSNEKKLFERLMRKIKSEINNSTEIRKSTLHSYEKFLTELIKNEVNEKTYDTAEGILFYAKP